MPFEASTRSGGPCAQSNSTGRRTIVVVATIKNRMKSSVSAPAHPGLVSGRARQPVFPAAPPGIHSERGALQNGFDLPDLSLLEFEHLGDLPGPGIGWTAGNRASVGSLIGAFLAESM